MSRIGLGLVGVGKIARDQHLPAIADNPDLQLLAVANRSPAQVHVPCHGSLEALLDAEPDVAAVSVATPPVGRYAIARTAIERGRHLMLEKPPGATVSEVEDLIGRATDAGVTLFLTWHAREAAGVEAARAWLADKTVRRVEVIWKEDVRRWHPGQQWIWEPGGLGVFDPGVNALSVVTAVLTEPMVLQESALDFPANRAAPIAADLRFATPSGAEVAAAFDWRQTGPQTWDVRVETDGGSLRLIEGGARLFIDDAEQATGDDRGEYLRLYARFVELIRAGRSDADLAPFRHVADAFMLGRRREVEPVED